MEKSGDMEKSIQASPPSYDESEASTAATMNVEAPTKNDEASTNNEEASKQNAESAPVTVQPAVVMPMAALTVAAPVPMGPQSQAMFCPSCHAQIVTEIKMTNTTKTHLWALCLCCVGGVCCAWIPYVVDSCRNADHYCPNCSAYLGSYK